MEEYVKVKVRDFNGCGDFKAGGICQVGGNGLQVFRI